MPAMPPADSDTFETLGYWTSLLHLFIYRLGWRQIADGLHWWYHNGIPDDTVELAMLKHIWFRDGLLGDMARLAATSELVDGVNLRRDPAVVRWAKSLAAPLAVNNAPPPNGTRGKHLERGGMHTSGPVDEPPAANNAILMRSSRAERRAVVTVESMRGWYSTLAHLGATLPDIGQRSWHVDVFVKQLGWLGTFRQSRVTEIWFTGPHRYHRIGV